MTEDEYLLQLARLLTRYEDTTTREARATLLELVLRIRALILTSFGTTTNAAVRTLLYSQLRPQILALLQTFTTTYYANLRTTLLAAEPQIRALTEQFFNLPKNTLTPLTLAELLAITSTLNRPTRDLLSPTPSGISPFTLQLERLINNTIQPAILRETPTPNLLQLLITTRNIAGRTTPYTPKGTIPKGTATNALLERIAATTSAILWSLNAPFQTIAATLTTPPSQWRWNAILDPKTCPICRPLNNTVAPTPQDFPRGAPPLHPRCRCVVIPEFP